MSQRPFVVRIVFAAVILFGAALVVPGFVEREPTRTPTPSTTRLVRSSRASVHTRADEPASEASVPAMEPVAVPFVAGDRALSAGDDASGLATRVESDGTVHILHARSLDLGLRLARAGRSHEPTRAPSALRVDEGRAVLDRGAIREWYVSAARGVEQGFDILTRPLASGLVTLELGVSGAVPVERGDGIVFASPDGTDLAAYRALVVSDATGRSLAASMRVVDGDIHIAFDDRDAEYPVRVDPFVSMLLGTLNAPMAEMSQNEGCGYAVSIRAALAVVGCPFAEGPGNETDAGAAYVFQEIAGTGFSFVQRLVPSIVVPNAHFGKSVVLNGRIVVGAPNQVVGAFGGAGAAYVFAANGANVWSEFSAVIPQDPSDSLNFGASVALEGDLLVVGAPNGSAAASVVSTGTVYLVDVALATPGFGPEFAGPMPAAGDGFGSSVAISTGHIAVGAPQRDQSSLLNAGAAYVYNTAGASAPSLAGTLLDPAPSAGSFFGYDVDIAFPTAVVGCPRANTARGTASGAVGVYEFTSAWARTDWLVAPDGLAADFLGTSVAIAGDAILAGSPATLNFSAATRGGAAYLFVDEGSAFTFAQKMRPSDTVNGDGVGFDVDLDRVANRVILGMPLDQVGNVVQAGSARVFDIPPFAFVRVGVHGGGTGSVLSVPDGILCPTDCVEPFGIGATLMLTPTPAAGSYLASVTGDCLSASCSLSVSVDRSVDFTFELKKANGVSCSAAVQCTSNNCVDGVCCNDGCAAGAADCQACSVLAGGMVDGTCGPLASAAASARVCHPSAGGCDPVETCVTTSTQCPADMKRASGYVCHPSLSSVCDPAETCDGASATCPTDLHAAATTLCDNGISCDGIARCNAVGQCVDGPAPTCLSDNNPCTVDVCVDPVGCINAMQPGCMVVDGGAVFVDAGLELDGSVDGSSEGGVPPPPTFRGQGGCSCQVAGSPPGATPARVSLAGLLAIMTLALARAARRPQRSRIKARK